MDDLESWKALAREHRGITMALAEFIAGLRPSAIPGPTREVLDKALVDGPAGGPHLARVRPRPAGPARGRAMGRAGARQRRQ